jgi:hypothetical protein
MKAKSIFKKELISISPFWSVSGFTQAIAESEKVLG